MEDKDVTGADGLRSSMNMSINRCNPDSLLPSIPLIRKVMCIDHAAARVAEKLINLTLDTIVDETSVKVKGDVMWRVDLFCDRLRQRDVLTGHIDIVNGKVQVLSIIFNGSINSIFGQY